jgi:predicted HTH domain antitoxin
MLSVEGIYRNGQVILKEKIESNQPVKVLVTFLEENTTHRNNTVEKLVAELYANDNITFKQAQHLLNYSNWQDTASILEQYGCQLYYDKDDLEEDLETVSLFDKIENSQ